MFKLKEDDAHGFAGETALIAAAVPDGGPITLRLTGGAELTITREELWQRFYQVASPSYIVGLYDCDRAYGGGEEGGWYYDCGELVRQVRVFRREQQAWAYARRLNGKLKSRRWGPNEGRRSISSVLSEGEYQAHVYEGVCPAHFPEVKPHYE